jgi:hypothetical protein
MQHYQSADRAAAEGGAPFDTSTFNNQSPSLVSKLSNAPLLFKLAAVALAILSIAALSSSPSSPSASPASTTSLTADAPAASRSFAAHVPAAMVVVADGGGDVDAHKVDAALVAYLTLLPSRTATGMPVSYVAPKAYWADIGRSVLFVCGSK